MTVVVVYLILVSALYCVGKVLSWRASSWEAHFLSVSTEADDALKAAKAAGDNALDLARSQMRLVRLAEKQDAASSAHAFWEGLAGRVWWACCGLAGWRNTSAGYLMGAKDVAAVLVALAYFGVELGPLVALARSYMGW